MTDTIDSRVFGKPLIIGQQWKQGGQGIVFETDDPGLLVKQFEPSFITDNPQGQEAARLKAERAYPAFSQVNKGTRVELKSLPREFVRIHSKPAYLMEKAEGQLLQALLRDQALLLSERLCIALALARAISLLHAAQMIHTDVHGENYIVSRAPTGWMVSIIDIDGGGLLSPPGPIYPMSLPKRLYKAPELFSTKWRELHELGLFSAPDNWALAVLLYQLLVDYQGPFCSAATHPDQSITKYEPYAPFAYREPDASWPLPWQEALFKRTGLPDGVVSLFYQTFQHRFLREEQRLRPTASDWKAALERAITPPPALPVSTLRVSPPPSVRGPAPPGSKCGWVKRAGRLCLRLGARLTRTLRCAFAPARGALRWLPAVAGLVGLGHPAFIAQSTAGLSLVRPSGGTGQDLVTVSTIRGHMMPTPPHHTQPASLAPKSFAAARMSPVVVGERDEAILRAIAKFRYASAKDIAHLLPGFSPSSLSHVREVMTRLAGGGDYQPNQYLLRFPRPQTRRGVTEKIFTLGARGSAYLAEVRGEAVPRSRRPSYVKAISYTFLTHALLLTRVVAALTYFVRIHPGYALPSCRLSYDLATTRDVPSATPETEPQPLPVIPDAWALLERPTGPTGLWLEIDCGTETKTKYQKALAARLTFLQEDYERVFGTPFLLVCYLSSGPQSRRIALQDWTEELLREPTLADMAGLFRFAAVDYDSLYSTPLFDAAIWYRPDEPNPVALLTPPDTQKETPHDPQTTKPSLVPTTA